MYEKWIQICGKINGFFENCFEKWARFVYRNSIVVIVVSLVVSLGLCAGFVRFKQQSDGMRLYVPQESEAVRELDEVKPFFNLYMFEMDFIIFSNKTNIIRKDVFDFVDSIQSDIGKIQTESGLTLETRCFKSSSNSCIIVSPLDLIPDKNYTNIEADLLKAYKNNTLMGNGRPASINFPGLFGNLKMDQVNGNMSATSVRIVYPVHTAKNSEEYDQSKEFDTEYRQVMEKWSEVMKEHRLEVVFLGLTTTDVSVSENSGGDITLMVVAVCIMLVLCVLFMASLVDTVESHFLLAIVAIISIILGIGSGFGIIMAAGQWYVAFIGVLPFLVLAVGVDDMFIIVDELGRASPDIRGEDRLALVLRRVGAPITMTTLTDLVAFAISTVSDFPGIRYFGQYAAMALTATYFMMMTLFLGVLKFDIRRVERGRRDYFPCCLEEKGRKENPWKGKVTHMSQKIMGAYGKILMKTPMRIAVCVLYLGLLAAGIYGFTKLEVKFDSKLFAKDGSNYMNWVTLIESDFPSAGFSVSIVTHEENIDYTSSFVQKSIIDLNKILNNNEYYDGDATVNWLSNFYLTATTTAATTTATNSSTLKISNFYPSLRSFLIQNPLYLTDIIFTEGADTFLETGQGKIRASKITARAKDNADWSFRRWSMENLRKDLQRHEENTGLHFVPANYNWVFTETVGIVAKDTAQNIGICACAVLIITLPYVFLPGISFFMLLSFACLILELSALMVVWDVQLNTISMTIIIMSIGFSVDYMAHIAHSYVVSTKDTAEERMIHSLSSMGGSVLKGGISTFIGVLASAFSTSKVFLIFFKMMFTIVVLGLLHGVLFLPVLLSLFCRTNLNLRSSDDNIKTSGAKENPAYELEPQVKYSPSEPEQS